MTVFHFLLSVLSIVQVFNSCHSTAMVNTEASNHQFVASTPGDDALIKKYLAIPAALKTDFIRWDLDFKEDHSFILHIHYGESRPNTLGFEDDGIKQTYSGKFKKINIESLTHPVFQFESDDHRVGFSTVQLNANPMHLLDQENKLMNGNGGWSFTLNRKTPVAISGDKLPVLFIPNPAIPKSVTEIFDGRTPCAPFAEEHHLNARPECFKLKWRFIFHRDSSTFQPTTFAIRSVINNRAGDITGTWNIVPLKDNNPDAVIYQLNFSEPEKTMKLLVGDEHVLFFLNKEEQLYVGNADFSFTLNKKS